MAKKDSGSAGMTEESIDYLEDVKKGKPRKFAMICKGTSVVSLVVYKKGNVEKRKKEAKEAGKGQFYFGVVDGKGIDIRFVLARNDGFESEPVKTTSLKSFLEESAGLKCKPSFEIVDAAPQVLDEEDPMVVRFLGLRNKAAQNGVADPNQAAEIKAMIREIEQEFEQEQPTGIESKLAKLEKLLGSLSPVAPQSKATPQTPPASQPDTELDAKKSKLAVALKKLKPVIDKVIDADPSRKSELFQALAKIAGDIKQGQLDQAQSAIVALGKLVQGLSSSQKTGESSELSQLQSRFETLKDRLEPQFLDARRNHPDKSTPLLNLWNYAIDQAAEKNLTSALTALDKLEVAMNKLASVATATNTGANGLEQALAKWTAARGQVIDSLKALERNIRAMNDPDGDKAIILVKSIQSNLTSRPDNPQAVAELERYLNTDEVISDAEEPNGFGIDVTIRNTLLPVLSDLRAALGA